MTATADFGPSLLSGFVRAAGVALLAIGAGLALMFAFAAALVVGVMIAGAALAMRFAPRRRAPEGAVLEARRTPAGWVVEMTPKRAS